MAALLDCLENVIGLSENPCPCLEPVPTSESLSGLYVDDKSCGVPLGMIPKDCSTGSIWDYIKQAKKEGIRAFISDFQMGISQVQKTVYNPFKGVIGSAMPTSNAHVSDSHVGIWFESCGVKGSTMKIKCVGLAMDCDGDFDIELFASNQVDPILTVPISVTRNKKVIVDLEEPLTVPLFDSKGRKIKYCLLYDRKGCTPKLTKFHCGCGGSKPKFYNYLNMGGVTGNGTDKSQLTDCAPNGKSMHGLCLDVELKCAGIDWLCDVSKDDWCNDPFFASVAKTIQYYAIKFLAKSMANNYASFQIQCDLKQLYNKQTEANNAIAHRMDWLRENIPADRTDCYICKGKSGLTKTAILV